MKNISSVYKSTRLMSMIAIVTMIFAMSFFVACGRSTTAVIIAGSTSVQPFVEVLEEEYAILYPDSEIDIQGGGSSAGITAVETGAADIGMSSRELDDKEQGFWSIEIAKDSLAIIINPDNPVADLTTEQVRDIYAAEISDWSEVGGPEAKIHIITREEGSGTRSAFESLVMGTKRITPKAIVQASNGSVRQIVSGDIYSIGFISLGVVDQSVKALALDGIAPTRGNVLNGSYHLYRPFLFVMKTEPAGMVKQFIDFTLSPEGQQVLMHEGLITQSERVEIEGAEDVEI